MMNERLTEWECSKIANNLDRMDDYRVGSETNMYIDGVNLSESLTEWDAQKIANNLDRINDYREGGILHSSENFIGLVFGLPIFIILIFYIIGYMFF